MTNGTGPVIPANEGAPELGVAQRFFGVFTDPVLTFAAIVRKPGFWPPLIALMIATIAAAELMLSKIGMEQIVRKSIEVSGRAKTMTPEQLENAVRQGAKVGAIFAHLGFLAVPIVLIIIAALGMLILKAGFGHPIDFKTAFSIASYSDLPTIIAAVLGMVLIGFGDPSSFNPQNFAPTNLGFFISPESVSRPVYSLATSLDLFSFWVMGLLGIGFAAATSRKVRPRSAFFCFLGLWVIWTLIKAGLAAI